MPSFSDSAFIFFLALLLFGPKKLPELARQLGKLMGEFRRASNEFRMQMEDELRVAEQAENQKKIAAIEAAAPVAPALEAGTENTIAAPIEDPMDLHPHTAVGAEPVPDEPVAAAETVAAESVAAEPAVAAEPVPIASSGDLHMMPPATGLPVGRSAMHSNANSASSAANSTSSSVESVFAAIPEAPAEMEQVPHRASESESELDGIETTKVPQPVVVSEMTQHG